MIRFATIGSGPIVDQFLTEAQKHPEFTLTAVYSRTGERAAEFAAQWGAALTFTDLNQLAACGEVDAVYIASPNLCHAEQAITLMKAGKHILCEKPMATTYIDCDGMVLQAHNSHVILLEGMRTLFAPGFARLHQLILPDGLGEIAPDLFPEALAQTRFHAAAKLVGILLFHLPPQPCEISAREAVSLVAQRLQSFRRVKAELSARADQHQPAAVIFRRVYAQALRIDVLRAGDRPVIQALCAAHIDQPVASLLPFFQFLHADFHVAFLALSVFTAFAPILSAPCAFVNAESGAYLSGACSKSA